jgi:hypothetical protein
VRSETVTAVLPAPQRAVFEYMSDIEKLPHWATEFARELKREGQDYKVVNRLGEPTSRLDPETRVIDMFAGPSKDQMAIFPSRAVPLPDGRTAFSFTMFQGPGTLFGWLGSGLGCLVRCGRRMRRARRGTGWRGSWCGVRSGAWSRRRRRFRAGPGSGSRPIAKTRSCWCGCCLRASYIRFVCRAVRRRRCGTWLVPGRRSGWI